MLSLYIFYSVKKPHIARFFTKSSVKKQNKRKNLSVSYLEKQILEEASVKKHLKPGWMQKNKTKNKTKHDVLHKRSTEILLETLAEYQYF